MIPPLPIHRQRRTLNVDCGTGREEGDENFGSRNADRGLAETATGPVLRSPVLQSGLADVSRSEQRGLKHRAMANALCGALGLCR